MTDTHLTNNHITNNIKQELFQIKTNLIKCWKSHSVMTELYKNNKITKANYDCETTKIENEIDYYVLRFKVWGYIYETHIVVDMRKNLNKETVIDMLIKDTVRRKRKYKMFVYNINELKESIITVKNIMKSEYSKNNINRINLRFNYKTIDYELKRITEEKLKIKNYNKSCDAVVDNAILSE